MTKGMMNTPPYARLDLTAPEYQLLWIAVTGYRGRFTPGTPIFDAYSAMRAQMVKAKHSATAGELSTPTVTNDPAQGS